MRQQGLPTRTLELNYHQVEELLNSLYPFWVKEATKGNLSREDLYRDYHLKKFYEHLRRRQFNMLANSNKVIKVKFDVLLAVLMVDVLPRTTDTPTSDMMLMKLGAIVPPQMLMV